MTSWQRNELGPYLDLVDPVATALALGISPGDRVLDVGGASNPFPRANVCCDLSFGETSQRNGAAGVFQTGVRYVEAPIERLPFDDGEFDFVICRQVLEHVRDPAVAAAELSRVARRGLVEVPTRTGELMNGNPTHRWIVDRVGDTLEFHPRRFVEHPFDNLFYGVLFSDAALRERADVSLRNAFNHQVAFEGSLSVRVVDGGGARFDYDDAIQAGRSHYSFARNCLLRGAELTYAYPDAHLAVRLLPGRSEPRRLLAVYQCRLTAYDDALASLEGLDDRASDALRRMIRGALSGALTDARVFPVPGPMPKDLGPSLVGSDRPCVSVAVVGTREAGLREAIESVLTQDYPDVRPVLATSLTDAAVARCIGHLSGIARLQILRVREDAPAFEVLHAALTACRGEIVATVMPGDRLECHHLDRLVAALLASDAHAVVSDRLMLDGSGVISAGILPGNPAGVGFSLSTVVAHNDAFIRAGAPNGFSETDFWIWVTEFAARNTIVTVPIVTVESFDPLPGGTVAIEAARAQLRLRPMELYRELVCAHAEKSALVDRIRELEQRIAKGGPA